MDDKTLEALASGEPDPHTLPRRVQVDRMTPAELAIREAIQEVENIGVDILLTDAVNLLAAAKDSVADYVDGIANKRRQVHYLLTEETTAEDCQYGNGGLCTCGGTHAM